MGCWSHATPKRGGNGIEGCGDARSRRGTEDSALRRFGGARRGWDGFGRLGLAPVGVSQGGGGGQKEQDAYDHPDVHFRRPPCEIHFRETAAVFIDRHEATDRAPATWFPRRRESPEYFLGRSCPARRSGVAATTPPRERGRRDLVSRGAVEKRAKVGRLRWSCCSSLFRRRLGC